MKINEKSSYFEGDDDRHPETIETAYGQTLTCEPPGKPFELLVSSPYTHSARIKFPAQISSHEVVDRTVRSYIYEQISSLTNLSWANSFIRLIASFDIPKAANKNELRNSLSNQILKIDRKNCVSHIEPVLKNLKGYVIYCIEEEEILFSERLADEIEILSSKLVTRQTIDPVFDPELRPYSAHEIHRISDSLQSSKNIATYQKALILICRDLGIRPIQVATMREEDFAYDNLGAYLVVYGAKGRRKSKLRRNTDNLSKKYISKDATKALEELIEENKLLHQKISTYAKEWCNSNGVNFIPLVKPLFPRRMHFHTMDRYLSDTKLYEYAPHCRSSSVTAWLTSASNTLAIKSSDGDNIKISAYRFRRTLGVSMAIAGFSAIEIAVALDHTNTRSIDHYLRWSRDVLKYVNDIYSESEELNEILSRLITREEADTEHDLIRLSDVANLGICTKNGHCEYHPTVSCYSCSRFMPYTDGDHEKALINISTLRDDITENSTGPLRRQLDEAYHAAKTIVQFQKQNK